MSEQTEAVCRSVKRQKKDRHSANVRGASILGGITQACRRVAENADRSQKPNL